MVNSQTCRVCGSTKHLDEFEFRNDTLKHRTDCKECRAHREVARRYDVTLGFIQKLKDAHNNSCAICGIHADDVEHVSFKHNPLVVDHDHSTGEVRGLLCPTCNNMLGHARDNKKTLFNAILYLAKGPSYHEHHLQTSRANCG